MPWTSNIESSTKYYFIHPGFREFFETWFSIFEVVVCTFAQQKNMDELFPTLLERTGLEREQFRVILTQEYCSFIAREGYHGDGNPYVFLKPWTKFGFGASLTSH